jgi:hypothetical protein
VRPFRRWDTIAVPTAAPLDWLSDGKRFREGRRSGRPLANFRTTVTRLSLHFSKMACLMRVVMMSAKVFGSRIRRIKWDLRILLQARICRKVREGE